MVARYVHMLQKDQILPLKSSCVGIVNGVLLGLHIQRFMVRNNFHNKFESILTAHFIHHFFESAMLLPDIFNGLQPIEMEVRNKTVNIVQ